MLPNETALKKYDKKPITTAELRSLGYSISIHRDFTQTECIDVGDGNTLFTIFPVYVEDTGLPASFSFIKPTFFVEHGSILARPYKELKEMMPNEINSLPDGLL